MEQGNSTARLFSLSTVGLGCAGKNMALRRLERGKELNNLPAAYIAFDVNGTTLRDAYKGFNEIAIPGVEFHGVLLPARLEEGRTQEHGTGFSPVVGEAAFRAGEELIANAMAPYHFAEIWVGIGKGTGTGGLVPYLEFLRKMGIEPIVNVSLPSKNSQVFSPDDFEDCWERMKRVMALGFRVIAVDTTVLDLPLFAEKTEEQAYAMLDQQTVDVYFNCIGRIINNPSILDVPDLVRFTRAKGGGLLVPIYGNLLPSAAAATEADAGPSELEAPKVPLKEDVERVWQESILPYYDVGPELQNALVVRRGQWTRSMISALHACVRDFNPQPAPSRPEAQEAPKSKNKRRGMKVTPAKTFRIIDACVDQKFPGWDFAVLIATSPSPLYTPKASKEPPLPEPNWKWQDVKIADRNEALGPPSTVQLNDVQRYRQMESFGSLADWINAVKAGNPLASESEPIEQILTFEEIMSNLKGLAQIGDRGNGLAMKWHNRGKTIVQQNFKLTRFLVRSEKGEEGVFSADLNSDELAQMLAWRSLTEEQHNEAATRYYLAMAFGDDFLLTLEVQEDPKSIAVAANGGGGNGSGHGPEKAKAGTIRRFLNKVLEETSSDLTRLGLK